MEREALTFGDLANPFRQSVLLFGYDVTSLNRSHPTRRQAQRIIAWKAPFPAGIQAQPEGDGNATRAKRFLKTDLRNLHTLLVPQSGNW